MGTLNPIADMLAQVIRSGVAQRYETALTPEQESAFQQWKAVNAPHDSGEDYDLRGAFLGNIQRGANGHGPDTYKKPNHPTFSDQSQYSVGPTGVGGNWGPNGFQPAPANFDYQSPEDLRAYLLRVEGQKGW